MNPSLSTDSTFLFLSNKLFFCFVFNPSFKVFCCVSVLACSIFMIMSIFIIRLENSEKSLEREKLD